MFEFKPINLKLKDHCWKINKNETIHQRLIARAIVFDDDGFFYFVKVHRDDDFGKCTVIETSGGGVEEKETIENAIKRELKEELGFETEIIKYLGVVDDYYNLINRNNLNNYFLCKVVKKGKKSLREDEINQFNLQTLKLTKDEAFKRYKANKKSKLGTLIYNREIKVFKLAVKYLEKTNILIH